MWPPKYPTTWSNNKISTKYLITLIKIFNDRFLKFQAFDKDGPFIFVYHKGKLPGHLTEYIEYIPGVE